MPFRIIIVRPIAAAAVLLSLAACGNLARPGSELWPYEGGQAAGATGVPAAAGPAVAPAPAAAVTGIVLAEQPPAALVSRSVDGRDTVFVANRDASRTITVVYQLDGGQPQRVIVAPGQELAVGYQPGRIISVQ